MHTVFDFSLEESWLFLPSTVQVLCDSIVCDTPILFEFISEIVGSESIFHPPFHNKVPIIYTIVHQVLNNSSPSKCMVSDFLKETLKTLQQTLQTKFSFEKQ